jgi:hypothetical protein
MATQRQQEQMKTEKSSPVESGPLLATPSAHVSAPGSSSPLSQSSTETQREKPAAAIDPLSMLKQMPKRKRQERRDRNTLAVLLQAYENMRVVVELRNETHISAVVRDVDAELK